ncbi:MAG TPA: thiamine pyrophosphate-dependent enzyme [Terracidiphilus sp.]|jgi:hypothetical protein
MCPVIGIEPLPCVSRPPTIVALDRLLSTTRWAIVALREPRSPVFSHERRCGHATVWAARHLTMNARRRLIGSFNHGSMVYALPQACDAQALDRGREVISISGDGGVAMLAGELLTAEPNQLPLKVVVFNNGAPDLVELEMKASGYDNYK